MQIDDKIIYGYDGCVALTNETWKCATCDRFFSIDTPCLNSTSIKYPNAHLEPNDSCKYYNKKEYIVKENLDDNILEVQTFNKTTNKYYKGAAKMDFGWSKDVKDIVINKAINAIEMEIYKSSLEYSDEQPDIEENEMESYNEQSIEQPIMEDENKIELDNEQPDTGEESLLKSNNQKLEDTLKGNISINWFNRVTSWKRVLNAARRTIGKTPSDKEPSNSWKAKILLAEHSPIRLLEYDWGWSKIRQWVSVHLVRHHEGVEKFVHSQRSDRRDLPCDRDHLYQGARNDMDMTANAQALINISRKRCCNCASTETREAWSIVLDELEKTDPVLRSKCVPECVYRGFCPEWMSKCKYYTTDNYKRARAEYVNTKYDKDVKYFNFPSKGILVSNTGHVYKTPNELKNELGIVTIDNYSLEEVDYKKEFINGKYHVYVLDNDNNKQYVSYLVINSFSDSPTHDPLLIIHIDGNEWNNNISNLKKYIV